MTCYIFGMVPGSSGFFGFFGVVVFLVWGVFCLEHLLSSLRKYSWSGGFYNPQYSVVTESWNRIKLKETSGDSCIQLLIYSNFNIFDRGDIPLTGSLSYLFQCLTSLMLKKTEGGGEKFVLCLTSFLYFSLFFLSFH